MPTSSTEIASTILPQPGAEPEHIAQIEHFRKALHQNPKAFSYAARTAVSFASGRAGIEAMPSAEMHPDKEIGPAVETLREVALSGALDIATYDNATREAIEKDPKTIRIEEELLALSTLPAWKANRKEPQINRRRSINAVAIYIRRVFNESRGSLIS